MKIWILTGKFGQGHFSAAKALEEEFAECGHEVIVSDVMEVLYPVFSKTIYYVFNNIICRSTTIYNFINEFGRNKKERKSQNNIITNIIKEIKPDIIITTWSACARIIGHTEVPVYVCITDVGVHEGWIYNNVEGYLVASSDVKKRLIEMGIEKNKIYIRGIPVKKAFHRSRKKADGKKNILIMGGGLGILPWIDEALEELREHPELRITVIAGKNERLYKKLKNKYPFVKVIGFTEEVHQYMEEADLLISKSGGVSLFEGIYTETPCIAVFPEYKHEIDNARFILYREIGEVVWKGQKVGEKIVNLLNDENNYRKFKTNIVQIKREIDIERKKSISRSYENVI